MKRKKNHQKKRKGQKVIHYMPSIKQNSRSTVRKPKLIVLKMSKWKKYRKKIENLKQWQC